MFERTPAKATRRQLVRDLTAALLAQDRLPAPLNGSCFERLARVKAARVARASVRGPAPLGQIMLEALKRGQANNYEDPLEAGLRDHHDRRRRERGAAADVPLPRDETTAAAEAVVEAPLEVVE